LPTPVKIGSLPTSNPRGLGGRLRALESILGKLRPLELALTSDEDEALKNGSAGLQPIPCNSYRDLINAWRKAMKWRSEMDDVLSIMLAVAASTEQVGDQLFLMVIADAGSGKTQFCDGMLISKSCHALEHITGFHSGWKGGGEGKDFSLISRINRKTLITPEGDTLISGANFAEIMGQQRRIFDGVSGSTYKNKDEDTRYMGLRTPWIMAGTFALLASDQSQLGDRFLKVFFDPPSHDEQAEILRRVGYTAIRSVMKKSSAHPESQMTPEKAEAYQLTGGYVDWLKSNIEDLLSMLTIDEDAIVGTCASLAEFTAFLRARPGQKFEERSSKEMPTRLTHQFVRLACCLAVVLNRKTIDEEVMRRVKKVAINTASGQTMEMVRCLYRSTLGLDTGTLAAYTHYPMERTQVLVRFLRKIHVIEREDLPLPNGAKNKQQRWKLTNRLRKLYAEIEE